MVGITTKIGEFFASLVWAVFGATAKIAVAGVIGLALLVGLLFAVQALIARRDRK